jgi:hypothetical protein
MVQKIEMLHGSALLTILERKKKDRALSTWHCPLLRWQEKHITILILDSSSTSVVGLLA